MSGMTSHAQGKSRTPGLGAAWAVLIGTGATSVTYNVVHAVHWLTIALALLLGFMPAFIAACLSHVAAVLDAPRWVIVSVIAVMGGGMVLSAANTAAVVAPAEPGWRGWLFGIVLDAGALLALWAIMASRRRKNEAAMTVEAAHAQVQATRTEAAEVVQNAREQAAAAEGERSRIANELATVKAELGAELETVKAELDRAREAVQRGGPRRRSSGPRKAPVTAPADDLTTELRAVQLLDAHPELRRPGMGTELARRLGVTGSYGRKLHRRLTAEDRPAEPVQERPSGAVQDRPQER